jgi:hypothetical protein
MYTRLPVYTDLTYARIGAKILLFVIICKHLLRRAYIAIKCYLGAYEKDINN